MFIMQKILLTILFITSLFAVNFRPYISPAIQIGINTSGNFFSSYQITLGIFNANFKIQ